MKKEQGEHRERKEEREGVPQKQKKYHEITFVWTQITITATG